MASDRCEEQDGMYPYSTVLLSGFQLRKANARMGKPNRPVEPGAFLLQHDDPVGGRSFPPGTRIEGHAGVGLTISVRERRWVRRPRIGFPARAARENRDRPGRPRPEGWIACFKSLDLDRRGNRCQRHLQRGNMQVLTEETSMVTLMKLGALAAIFVLAGSIQPALADSCQDRFQALYLKLDQSTPTRRGAPASSALTSHR